MIRLLHVCPADADYQTSRAVGHLARGLGAGFEARVRRIGRGGEFGSVATAAIGLRRLVGDTDLVHAWGMSALSAVAMTPVRHVVFTPIEFPSRRQIGWLRAIMHYRDVNVISPTATLRRRLIERAVPPERCHLIRPGVEFARIKRRRDRELRARLGFDESHHVLLAPGESTREADHRQATWAAGILNVLDQRTRLLLWGRGPMARSMKRFAQNLDQPELVTLAEGRLGRAVEFEELLPASDMAVVSATGPVAALSICACMAAGLPIAATVTPTVAELLEDRHTALMTQPGVPRRLAERILELRRDVRAQWSLSDMARTEAYEYFSLTRFLEQHRVAYRQASAGMRVEVPEQTAGAGLRFHGRA
jgi:glycosyltransferase involved in cell wall biosynthesis